jgi:S1-C subfamily serine protease/pSer/pThr/pTyr-binding forkhead associated (FHA) protein
VSRTPAVIGSEPGLEVVVPGAAARHAVVVERDGDFVLKHGGSPQGTFLAGEPVEESVLHDGDVIQLGPGGPQLRFQREGGTRPPPPRAPGLTIPPVLRTRLGPPRASRALRVVLGGLLAVSLGFLALTYRQSRRLEDEMARLAATVRAAEEERRVFQLRVEEERHRFRRERRALEERLEQARTREAELSARLADAASGEVQALRAELSATRGRLETLETERAAAERIIREYGAGVCLIQGSYAFYDAGDRPLRYRLDAAGRAVQSHDGSYDLDVAGGGGVHTTLYFGTGFMADRRGLVLTNRHVGEPWWKDGAAQALVEKGFRPRMLTFRAFFPNVPAALPLSLERVSEEADLALLRVDGRTRNIPVLPIDAGRRAAVPGRPVVLVGYPTGLEALLAKADAGVVRQILDSTGTNSERVTEALGRKGLIRPSTTQGHIGDVTRTDIVFDAPTTEGGSGGPVFNLSGSVIAVEYAVLQRFGGNAFGVPMRYAAELLRPSKKPASKPPSR